MHSEASHCMESTRPIKFCLERWLKPITCLYGSSARDLWCSGQTVVDRNILPSAQVLKHGSNGHYKISFLDIHNVSHIIRPVVTAHQACCSSTTSKLYEAITESEINPAKIERMLQQK